MVKVTYEDIVIWILGAKVSPNDAFLHLDNFLSLILAHGLN